VALAPLAVLVVASLLAAGLLSAAITWLSIRYARHHNLIDHPGRRRSHATPTPRGGGTGIVAATLAIFAAEMPLLPAEALPDLVACTAAIGIVAAVGWIDDHRGLGAAWRLLAHAVAALLVLGALSLQAGGSVPLAAAPLVAAGVMGVICLGLVWLGLIWSINLHNFMDGINGLLAFQALFVFASLAALCLGARADADAWHLAALAAAVAAFIPFNFPHARVFMGDVGSGVLGLLVGLSILRLLAVDGIAPASGVIAVSAFVTDASCNLASRMLRGRRWYSAHREHLYQWMVRAGMSHARVVAWYMGWNVLVVTPLLWWLNRLPAAGAARADGCGLGAAAVLYALAIALWICGKRWCLHKVKMGRSHAAA
jgi:UDP-N-acetylmuramyl pentapeptide phosphotransferase/UDP-N-acetylglucosamine-1-phosphate transferase